MDLLSTTDRSNVTDVALPNAFTVDVEDYYQVSAFDDHIQRNEWNDFESRVERNTHRLLDLLARHDVQGTFFVLGWVADRYPELVRDIHAAGHEIGSHSYWHRLVFQLTPDEFREDLCRSRDALEDIVGESITAFRAPSFSITKRSMWALEVLVEEGFQIDSSIVPIRHDRYGIPGARREIHRIDTPSGSLIEFPPSVYRIASFNLPVGGGGYFRLYPLGLSRYCLIQAAAQNNHPFMFYTHPWEIDHEQPRLGVGSFAKRFRHYVNLPYTERKLRQLLESFRFATMGEVLELMANSEQPDAHTPVH